MLEAKGVFGLFPANTVNYDDIEVYKNDSSNNVLENLSKSNNLISDILLKLPLLQVGQFAIPLIGFSLMALLLQALLPTRKVPLKPL